MTELLVGTKKGLFVLEGEPGAPFEVTARAFAGEPVEYALRDPRSGRVLASVTSPFYGPKIFVHRRPGRRVGAGRGRRAARGRRRGARADLGDRAPARPTARSTRAATPACCSRAATAARRWELNRGLWEHPTRPKWQPGGGGLCLHSIATWPGEPDRLAVGDLGRRRVADRRRRRDAGARATRASMPRYLPEDTPEDEVGLCVHRLRRAPQRPERIFMQFHGGVYRSDDAGESWHDIARRACRRTSASRSRSTPPTPTAPT